MVSYGQHQQPHSPSNTSPLSQQLLRHSKTDPSLSSHLTHYLPSGDGALKTHFGSSRTVNQMNAAYQQQCSHGAHGAAGPCGHFSGQQYGMSTPSTAADVGNNNRLVHRHHFPNSAAAHPYLTMQAHMCSCCTTGAAQGGPNNGAGVTGGSQIISPSSPTSSSFRNYRGNYYGGQQHHGHHHYGAPAEQQNTITFEAPGELSEETLLDKGHNETLAKLNFVLALVDSIFEYINSISSPMAVLSESIASDVSAIFVMK